MPIQNGMPLSKLTGSKSGSVCAERFSAALTVAAHAFSINGN